jgi:Mor family transcriptional regulator
MMNSEKVIKALARSYCELLDDDWEIGKTFYMKLARSFFVEHIQRAIYEAYDAGKCTYKYYG